MTQSDRTNHRAYLCHASAQGAVVRTVLVQSQASSSAAESMQSACVIGVGHLPSEHPPNSNALVLQSGVSADQRHGLHWSIHAGFQGHCQAQLRGLAHPLWQAGHSLACSANASPWDDLRKTAQEQAQEHAAHPCGLSFRRSFSIQKQCSCASRLEGNPCGTCCIATWQSKVSQCCIV